MLWRGPYGGGAASGKMGAMVASRARTTQYLKSRTYTGRLVPTALQAVIRATVAGLVAAWKSLTVMQRNGWSTYAANVTKTNRLGDSINVSGVSWYTGNNTVLNQVGLPIVSDAPTIFDRGEQDFTGSTLTAGGSAGTLTLIGSASSFGLTSADAIGVWAGRPYSAGNAKYYGATRLAMVIPGDDTASSFTFALPFGALDTSSDLSTMAVIMRTARGDGRVASPFTLHAS
jgi:hypothetical protein